MVLFGDGWEIDLDVWEVDALLGAKLAGWWWMGQHSKSTATRRKVNRECEWVRECE